MPHLPIHPGTYHTCRIAGSDTMGRDVLCHHTPEPNHCMMADSHSLHHVHMLTQPTCLPITTERDGFKARPCRSVMRWVSEAHISTCSANIHSSPISTRLSCPINTMFVLSSSNAPRPTAHRHPFPFTSRLIIATQPSNTTSLLSPSILMWVYNAIVPSAHL